MGLPEIRAALQTIIDGLVPTYNPALPYHRHTGSASHGQTYEDAVVISPGRMYLITLAEQPTDSQWSSGGVLDYAVATLELSVSYPIAGWTSLEELQDTMESDTLDLVCALRPVAGWDAVARNLIVGGEQPPTMIEVTGDDSEEVVAHITKIKIGVEYATGRQ